MADEQTPPTIRRLVEDHHEGVYRYAYRLSGSVADAEDLSQQVFLVAQQKLGQLRKAESARSWLFTILRNCFLKGRQRQQPVPAATLKLDIDSIPAEAPDDNEIDSERIQQALDGLPDDFRLVLVMFYYEQCSYREISEKLDVPMGTVMSRLARAKGRLRTKLFQAEPSAAS